MRKAYRKLALQYHPDRNSGREEECVPKFQAIQAANEVLGDASVKQKYDIDRRKAGLFPTGPTYNPRQAAPGNPYATNSPFPPPPRRTQPGVWQGGRPPPPGMAPGGSPASGADRFTNFPRAAPTARKDPGPDKATNHRAFQAAFPPQPRGPIPSQPPPPQQPRARPQPPPRQESKMPTEDQLRAGMKHQNRSRFEPETLDRNQTAWQQWSQQQQRPAPPPPRPGVSRTDSMRTPNRFNPNQPGSDEKPSSSHVHKNRSAEFARPHAPGIRVPPPPAGPPPSAGATPTTARSPESPRSQRPFADPTRPHSSRTPNDQVPYMEGNRNRTPYSSYIHEKTDLGEGLRRSASVRDTTKLDPNEGMPRGRARSTSPMGRQRPNDEHANGSGGQKPFVVYSDSDDSTKSHRSWTSSPDDMKPSTSTEQQRPGTGQNDSGPFGRPKKVPTSQNRSGGTSSRPATGNGTRSDIDQPDMQHKTSANMYESPFPSLSDPQIPGDPASRLRSTQRARRTWSTAGKWAIPSSINPSSKSVKQPMMKSQKSRVAQEFVTGADRAFTFAREDEQNAYIRFQSDLHAQFGGELGNLAMDRFLKLASTARKGLSCGHGEELDSLLQRICADFPLVGVSQSGHANDSSARSFTFPQTDRLFTPNRPKSRSEEHINTSFSDNWNGAFVGEPDYFAPPMATGRKQPSPNPRGTRTPNDQPRSATMDIPSTGAAQEEFPGKAWGSDGTPKETPPIPPSSDVRFSQEEWQKTFKDASWTWVPPPPRQGSPVKGGAAPNARKPSQARKASKAVGGNTASAQQVFSSQGGNTGVDGLDGNADDVGPLDDGDAMEIDDTPPANATAPEATPAQTSTPDKGARLYSVPPSAWRQQQGQKQKQNPSQRQSVGAGARNANTSNGTKLNTNLDDLRNVEPIAKTAPGSTGLGNFTGMNNTLPFPSEASRSQPTSTTTTVPAPSQLPPNPKPPPEPPRLSRTSWQAYSKAFGDYCMAFHYFNTSMLAHFDAAEKRAQLRFATGCGWLEQGGDTSGMFGDQTGFGSYAAETLALERSREFWNVGCERHAGGIREFDKVRERVRKLAGDGVLPEV